MSQEARHWPTQVRLAKDKRNLAITYDDGSHFDLPAEYLRVMSPSAEVQGHSADERVTVAGKHEVMIIGVEPVGHYAVRLVFDDLHETGLFTWDYLHELGRDHGLRWPAYLAELAAKGLTREPRRR
jgi:DUF971 family protein